MLKITVFGFYGPDQERISRPGEEPHLSPVTTQGFMRHVWEMEPPESRIGTGPKDRGVIKLTRLTRQPVYVQAVYDGMAKGAGLINCDGYIAIIDAVKILAPKTIHTALRRLYEKHPTADLIIAAGRQNEPDALSSEEIRTLLGLNPDLLVMPYAPGDPETVRRLIQRMVRYLDNPDRVPPPVFAGELPAVISPAAAPEPTHDPAPCAQKPCIHGLDHVAITVSSLERALAFYQEVLGFRVLGHLDFPGDPRGFTIATLDTGRGVIELFSFTAASVHPSGGEGDDQQVGIRHFALRVTGLDAIADRLRAAGVSFTIPPMNAHGGVRIAFFTDPDGTLIELIEGELTYSRR